jgi:hypothetical protein
LAWGDHHRRINWLRLSRPDQTHALFIAGHLSEDKFFPHILQDVSLRPENSCRTMLQTIRDRLVTTVPGLTEAFHSLS